MNDELSLDNILFGSVADHRVELRPAQGEIPETIRGTYYLNGPANLRRGNFTYNHWLDGDGLVRALRFAAGRAEYTSRLVRTRKYLDETAAGRPLYRSFGTAFRGDQLRRRVALESPANVSVFQFAGRLLACGEQSLPWELSCAGLETIGECNFRGHLPEITPFSAHPKIDGQLLCNFGLKYLLTDTKLSYWEFDDTLACVLDRTLDVRAPYSVHDFALSERFAAFYLSPYLLDIAAFLRKGRSIFDALTWQPEDGNELIVCERAAEGMKTTIALGRRGYCLHLINSFDDGESLVIDLIETQEPLYPQYCPLPNLFATVKPCSFVRITVDLKRMSARNIIESTQEEHLDFPTLLPSDRGRAYTHVWALAMPSSPAQVSKYYNQIVLFDWSRRKVVDRYRTPDGVYLAGEPSIMEGSEHTPGPLLICPRWHSRENRSDYLILKALELSLPPLAVLPLPQPSPLGFHSMFDPAG